VSGSGSVRTPASAVREPAIRPIPKAARSDAVAPVEAPSACLQGRLGDEHGNLSNDDPTAPAEIAGARTSELSNDLPRVSAAASSQAGSTHRADDWFVSMNARLLHPWSPFPLSTGMPREANRSIGLASRSTSGDATEKAGEGGYNPTRISLLRLRVGKRPAFGLGPGAGGPASIAHLLGIALPNVGRSDVG